MRKGIFITFEGIDGSGKSTHAKLLDEALRARGYSIVHTREPGGTPLAEDIRRILLNPDSHISSLAELLLYAASRAQHTSEIIKPALLSGKIVICERYTDATIAYQGYGRKLDLGLINRLNKISTCGTAPDLTIFLDIRAVDGIQRVGKDRKKDRLEKEKLDFHKRVRKGYLDLAKKYPGRIKVVDCTMDTMDVHEGILGIVEKFIRSRN